MRRTAGERERHEVEVERGVRGRENERPRKTGETREWKISGRDRGREIERVCGKRERRGARQRKKR